MTNKKTLTPDAAEGIQMPLHFNLPVGMPSKYATNLLLQVGPEEVLISFFEAQLPVVTDGDSEAVERLKKTGIRADCVSKIVVSRSRFIGFAKAITEMAEVVAQETENK